MTNFTATHGTSWADIVESYEFHRGWTEVCRNRPFDDSFIKDRPYMEDAQMRYERGRQVAVCYRAKFGDPSSIDLQDAIWAIADFYQQLRLEGTLCGSFGPLTR